MMWNVRWSNAKVIHITQIMKIKNKEYKGEELKKDKNSECLVDFSLTPLLIKDQGRKFTQSNDVFICYYDGSSCRLETILHEGDEADGGKCGDPQIEEDNKDLLMPLKPMLLN